MSDLDETLRGLREAIDEADSAVLAALEERYALTDRVTACKIGAGIAGGGHIFRPGREAGLLRRVMEKSKTLDPVLVESVWRQIIAFSLARQQAMTICYHGGEAIAAVARFRFGAAAKYNALADAVAVIDAVAAGRAHVGMLPHWDSGGGGWLGALAKAAGESRVYIAALTPFLAMPHLVRTVLLAPCLPDPSGDDTTLTIAGNDSDSAIGVKTESGYNPDAPGLLGMIQNPPAAWRG